VKPSGSQKPVADSNITDLSFGNLDEGFPESTGSGQAVFNQGNLIFGKANLFDKRKTFKRFYSMLFFERQFFRQQLVEGIFRALGNSRSSLNKVKNKGGKNRP